MNWGIGIVIAAFLLTACSAEEIYGSAQALQQHQCGKIADKAEYDRCMSRADSSYERP